MDEYIHVKLCGAIKIKITEVFWHWVTLGHNPSQCQEVQYVYIDYDMHCCTKPSIILSRTYTTYEIFIMRYNPVLASFIMTIWHVNMCSILIWHKIITPGNKSSFIGSAPPPLIFGTDTRIVPYTNSMLMPSSHVINDHGWRTQGFAQMDIL